MSTPEPTEPAADLESMAAPAMELAVLDLPAGQASPELIAEAQKAVASIVARYRENAATARKLLAAPVVDLDATAALLPVITLTQFINEMLTLSGQGHLARMLDVEAELTHNLESEADTMGAGEKILTESLLSTLATRIDAYQVKA